MFLRHVGIDGEEVRLGDRLHVLVLAGIGAGLDGVGHPQVAAAIHLLPLVGGDVEDGELAGVRRHQLGDGSRRRAGRRADARHLAVGQRIGGRTVAGVDQLEVLLHVQAEARQQHPVGSDGAGILPAERHRFALERDQVGDGAGLDVLVGDDELLDVLPEHGYRAHVLLGRGDRPGAGGRVGAEQALDDRELRRVRAERLHVRARAGGVDRREAELLLRQQLDLRERGDRGAYGMVGSAGRRGVEHVVLVRRDGGRRRQDADCRQARGCSRQKSGRFHGSLQMT